MKKIMSFFVMALLLMGIVPISIAEEGSNTDSNADIDDGSSADGSMEIKEETRIDDDKAETRTEIKAADGTVIKIKTEIKDGRERTEIKARLAGNGTTKEEIKARFESRREELKERLEIKDPEKLRRLEALDNVDIDKIAALDRDQMEKMASLSRARQAELAGMDQKDMEERLMEIKVRQVRNADDLKERVLTRQKMDIARESFDKARKDYNDAKEKYKDARQNYLEARNSGDEEAALEHAKEVLLNSADSIIAHLERVKSKIDENEQISEERSSSIIESIDAMILDIESVKDNIIAAQTKEEVRKAAAELKSKWQEVRNKAGAFAERVVIARVEGVLNQAEVLEKKLDKALAKMEEQGLDVDVAEEVATFSALVADAKASFSQAQDKLQEAIDSEDWESAKALTEEAKELLGNSRESLKDAHETLKEIVKKAREAGQELEIDGDAEVEVEEDEEDDDEDEEETEDEIEEESEEEAEDEEETEEEE